MRDPRPEDMLAWQVWLTNAERNLAEQDASAGSGPGAVLARHLLADDYDALADARDGLAYARDRQAADRDLAATDRDLRANDRDDAARVSPRRPDPETTARLLSWADRDDSRGDRRDSLAERRSAAGDRRRAAAHRHQTRG